LCDNGPLQGSFLSQKAQANRIRGVLSHQGELCYKSSILGGRRKVSYQYSECRKKRSIKVWTQIISRDVATRQKKRSGGPRIKYIDHLHKRLARNEQGKVSRGTNRSERWSCERTLRGKTLNKGGGVKVSSELLGFPPTRLKIVNCRTWSTRLNYRERV